MDKYQGFSLTEVLVSLMLLASIALFVLQQQSNVNYFFKQLVYKARLANVNYNQIEFITVKPS